MTSRLCDICQRIPPEFFSPQNDRSPIADNGLMTPLALFEWIRRSVSEGCALREVLMSSAQTDFLPPDVLES